MNVFVENPLYIVLVLALFIGGGVLVAVYFKPEILMQTYVVTCEVIDKYKTRNTYIVVVECIGKHFEIETEEKIYNNIEVGDSKNCWLQNYLLEPNKYRVQFM